MRIKWKTSRGEEVSGEVPVHLLPYVEAIGIEKAVALFYHLGGTRIYLAQVPHDDSLIAVTIGVAATSALAKAIGSGNHKLPLPSQFIARYLRSKGLNTQSIAREIKRDENTVRLYLRPDDAAPPPDKKSDSGKLGSGPIDLRSAV